MKKKRVIIFWGGEGYGHLVAAKAIEQRLKNIDPSVEVILKDTLDFPTRLTRKLITSSYYVLTQHMPKLFDHVYEYAMKTAETAKSIADPGMAKQYRPERMLKYIEAMQPDCVLVTFSPAAEMIVYLRDRGKLLDLPVGHVLLDYVSNHYFCRLGMRLEMSFTPHASFLKDFKRWGHPPEKMCASGVPILLDDLTPFSKKDRLDFFKEQKLNPKITTLVLVSGAAGVGNFPKIIKSLAKELKEPIQLLVICGKNKQNYSAVTKLAPQLPENFSISTHKLIAPKLALHFVKAADLVITKAGALTPTELSYIGKAVVYLDINGGQERHNAAFIKKHNLGKITDDQEAVGEIVRKLLANPNEINSMKAAQAKFCESLQPQLITDWVMAAISTKPKRK